MSIHSRIFHARSDDDPLMTALLARDARGMAHLLASGIEADVGFRDRLGRTPLMIAALLGDARASALLLGASDPDRKDQAGMTALMIACEHGHADCAEALAPASQIDLADNDGATALMFACHYGRLACVDVLAGAHADTALRDPGGRNALVRAILQGHGDCALRLASAPGYADADIQGVTPLMHACMAGRHEVVQALAGRVELDQLATDGHGATALSLAAYNGNTVCVKMLLAAGANPDVADRAGMTALMKAAIGREAASDSLRLLAGVADPRLRDAEGRTASDYARRRGHEDRALLLESRCAALDEREALGASSQPKGSSPGSKRRL